MSSITKGAVSIGVVGNSGDVEQLYITEEWRSIGNKKKKIAQTLENMIKRTVAGRRIQILLEVGRGEMWSVGFLGQF